MGEFMVTSIVNVALFAGIVLGAVLLIIVCMTYFKEKRFGLGGTLLSFFGVILLGLSIWSEVEFSFGRMRFHAIRQQISEVATVFDATMAEIEHIRADQDTLMLHVEQVQNNANMLFSNKVPSYVQDDITKIVERNKTIRQRLDSIEEKKAAVSTGLQSLLNAPPPPRGQTQE
jgi:hypothetical protein